jgi:hypothetical protein
VQTFDDRLTGVQRQSSDHRKFAHRVINCIDTDLENKIFKPIELHNEHEWLICSYENDAFTAKCSPEKLSESAVGDDVFLPVPGSIK